jgi:hypothetical protein
MLTITPNKGYVKATEFTFDINSSILNGNYSAFLWNFGDGNVSRKPSATHVYRTPDIYNISLNAYKDDGSYDTFTTQLSVFLYLNESIYFDDVPPPTFASHYNKFPFKINITSSNNGKHIVDLSTQFSKSYKNQLPRNKWSFLRPEWKFLDLNGNFIDSIETIDTEIKIDNNGKIDPNGTFVGVTGTAHFYIIDDLYNYDLYIDRNPYTTIIATLQTSATKSFHDSFNSEETLPSFSNSKAMAIMPHLFLWRYPDYIKITENGLDDIVKNKWSKAIHPLIMKFSFLSSVDFSDNLGNGVRLYKNDSDFCHYVPYNSSYNQSIDFFTLGISSNLNSEPEIYYFDPKTNYISSGYYKTEMHVEKISAENVTLSAYATIKTPPSLSSNIANPILWVSNPAAGMGACINYFYEDWIETLSTKNLKNAHVKIFDIPVINPITQFTFTRENHALSGFHGGYSIAALPAPIYQAWISDGERNFIHKIASNGQILSSIDINKVFVQNNFDFLVNVTYTNFLLRTQVSPAGISLDSEENLWVTLYDTFSAIKFDKNGNFLLNASPINSLGYNVSGNSPAFFKFFLDSSNLFDPPSGYDSNIIEPTCVECDINDDVWITYSSQLSGWVVKYDKNGNILNTINYPVNTAPKEIKTDKDGNVWIVGNQFKLTPDHTLVPPNPARELLGFIEKRNTNGALLSSFGPFNSINHLTLDKNEDPWFTYSYHWVATINNKNGRQRKIKILTDNYSDNIPEWFDPNENADETALEGISTDARGNVYVINSIENKMIVIDSDKFIIKDKFNINPKGFSFSNVGYEENGHTQIEFNYWSKSAQAQGDWSGYRWIKKYGNDKLKYLYNSLSSVFLSGKETNINFYVTNPFDFFKINENYDLTNTIKNLSFQPALKNSTFLFDNVLGSIFGKTPFSHDDIGIAMYEKISNFINNKNDIDTCDVDSLYDILNEVDLDNDDFQINFPNNLKNFMNNLSINQSRLIGGYLKDDNNFKDVSDNGNFNRGKILNTKTYMVTAGIPVILNTKSLKNYKLIDTGYIDQNNNVVVTNNTGLSTYKLSSLAYILDLGEYWEDLYEFFEYKPSIYNVNCDNVINWDFEQTLLNKTLSSNNEWVKDEGIIDTIFSYELYKGLGLLKD